MKNLTIAFLFAACLAGCGGGSADTPPKPPTSAPPSCTPVAQVGIDLFGDSTQAGYDGNNPSVLAVHTPAVALQQTLDAQFGAGKTLVVSRAVGSSYAQQLRDGTDGLNPPWPLSVTGNIAVVAHGIDDMQHRDIEPLTQYVDNLRFFASHMNGKLLVFETPNVVTAGDPTGTAEWAQAMRDVAAETHTPLADTYAITDPSMLGDWAHPTDAAYQVIVEKSLAPAVVPLVAKLLCR